MPTTVPAYFDFIIEGFRSGRAGRNVHLGFWDDPPPLATPCSAPEFEAAQARLTEIMLDLMDLHGGHNVLDVGCGLGGALEALGKWPDMRLVGINIDRRQLDICRTVPVANNALSLVIADACALPFRPASFDRVLCIEAAFHFRSRAAFLREAADVLRPGGRLVLSDMLLREPEKNSPVGAAAIEAAIRNGYGPWPQFWVTVEEIMDAARQAGLTPDHVVDVTLQTLPTYRVTAPQEYDGSPGSLSAGSMLRWLHATGHLSYLCLSFTKS